MGSVKTFGSHYLITLLTFQINMSSVATQIKDFMNTCQYEPWKTYCPYLYRQSREPVLTACTPPPLKTEICFNPDTTLQEINSFANSRQSYLEDRQKVYFWLETTPQFDNRYHVLTPQGVNELKGLEYPTNIWMKASGDFQYYSVEFPWTKQSDKVFSITMPDIPDWISLFLKCVLPPPDSLVFVGQLQTLKYLLEAVGGETDSDLIVRDLKPILYSCSYEGFLEPKPMAEFFLDNFESTSDFYWEDTTSRPYGILLLMEKLHVVGSLYLLVKIAPIPAILCYVTQEKPTTLVWSILEHIDQKISTKISLTDSKMRTKQPAASKLHLLSTPWMRIGRSTTLSLVSLYFQSKRVMYTLEGKGPDEVLLAYDGMIAQTWNTHQEQPVQHSKLLPKHNLNILRSSRFYNQYREYLMESIDVPDELFILSMLHHSPTTVNEKLRFGGNFFPEKFRTKILYYLHIAFPQTTLEDEERSIEEGKDLLMFTLNCHRRRAISP